MPAKEIIIGIIPANTVPAKTRKYITTLILSPPVKGIAEGMIKSLAEVMIEYL